MQRDISRHASFPLLDSWMDIGNVCQFTSKCFRNRAERSSISRIDHYANVIMQLPATLAALPMLHCRNDDWCGIRLRRLSRVRTASHYGEAQSHHAVEASTTNTFHCVSRMLSASIIEWAERQIRGAVKVSRMLSRRQINLPSYPHVPLTSPTPSRTCRS